MRHPILTVSSVLISLATLFFGGSALAQVSDLEATHQSGQTFLTWTELPDPDVQYRVYSSPTPITSIAGDSASCLGDVDARSSENIRQTQLTGTSSFFRITDLGPELTATQGLFVHTVEVSGAAYYAVTIVVDDSEDTALITGQNVLAIPVTEQPQLPRPVLQSTFGPLRHYVHWVSNRNTPFALAMWNRPSRGFNLRVVRANGFPGPRPVLLKLHARGGSYRLPGEPSHPETIVLSPDDWIGESPDNTFWYGINEAFPDTTQYADHLNVDYTVRRVMTELDFVLNESLFNADSDRVYTAGSSMGGVGAVFLAYRYPDRFAAAHAVIPKFDFGCSEDECWLEPATGDALWGAFEQNLPTSEGMGVYDRLNLGYLALQNPEIDRPILTTWNGRNDTVVGWPEKPPVFQALTSARVPATFLWDERNHMGANSAWTAVMDARRDELWSHRIDQAVPAFSNLSLNDDPGDGDPTVGDPIGCMNCYLDWNIDSVEDTPQHHSVLCTLRQSTELDDAPADSAIVDWTPRRLQSLPRIAGAHYRFTNQQEPDGITIEDRVVTADAFGIVTIENAIVTQAGNVLRLEPSASTPFRRGDANQDGAYNLGDAIFTLSSLFSGGIIPACVAAADSNADGDLNIADAVTTLTYLFAMGPPPPPPGPSDCGLDPRPSDCTAYPCP